MKGNCCLQNVAVAAGGHTSINMTSPWLFQPVDQVMSGLGGTNRKAIRRNWPVQPVSQMLCGCCSRTGYACTHVYVFFQHPQKTSCFHNRLLQPAAVVTACGPAAAQSNSSSMDRVSARRAHSSHPLGFRSPLAKNVR